MTVTEMGDNIIPQDIFHQAVFLQFESYNLKKVKKFNRIISCSFCGQLIFNSLNADI